MADYTPENISPTMSDDETPETGEAYQQLQQQQSKLLDTLDDLRALEIDNLPEPLQIVVCGPRSSGKSSVLEAISQINFPIGDHGCTTFATEVRLLRRKEESVTVWIEPGRSRVDEEEWRRIAGFTRTTYMSKVDEVLESLSRGSMREIDLPGLIARAARFLTNGGIAAGDGSTDGDEGSESGHDAQSTFHDDILKVEISGPDKPDVKLVDLPGWYTSDKDDEREQSMRKVHSVINRYLRHPKSIILTVSSTAVVDNINDQLSLIKRADPTRERIFGILTHPDTILPSSELERRCIVLLQNERHRLGLGWHVLRNRSSNRYGTSDSYRDTTNQYDLLKWGWRQVPREQTGASALRNRLSGIMFKHLAENLQELIASTQSRALYWEYKLSRLGGPQPTLQQQRENLTRISEDFERIVSQGLVGKYTDPFFIKYTRATQLRAVLLQYNNLFVEAMRLRGSRRTIYGWTEGFPLYPSVTQRAQNPYIGDWQGEYIHRDVLEKELQNKARELRLSQSADDIATLLMNRLFTDQIKPWTDLTGSYLTHIWDAALEFVSLVLQYAAGEHTASILISTIVEPQLKPIKQDLFDRADNLVAEARCARGQPQRTSSLGSSQPLFAARWLSNLKCSHRRTQSVFDSSCNDFSAATVIDQMQARYDIAIGLFINNVNTQVIEQNLLNSLEQLLNIEVLTEMDDNEIQTLAAEPPEITEKRRPLERELKTLEDAFRTLSVYSALAPTLISVTISIPPSGVPTSIQASSKLRAASSTYSNPVSSESTRKSHARSSSSPDSLLKLRSATSAAPAVNAASKRSSGRSLSLAYSISSLSGSDRDVDMDMDSGSEESVKNIFDPLAIPSTKKDKG
ncbi:P-loop containing nucleoside triphosphate hydrolase protein [Aspergillus crustosus]